jgi:hypothetical protein
VRGFDKRRKENNTKTQKKLREVAREKRDRGRRVEIEYSKIQING